ncbi:hypothetical protein [Aquabacter spiritensis]|uniref:Uncharacterized protein n=1 Tax=Aquabacter spiritensis TaxID=933073 RepID=A0A4R3LPH5_9HYPH|nr:hypothetical protein [Aquabacter spiritensis]TCT02383.1 hypothetical protein EDC64_11329 [Aquabacter spiritensis]
MADLIDRLQTSPAWCSYEEILQQRIDALAEIRRLTGEIEHLRTLIARKEERSGPPNDGGETVNGSVPGN